MPERVLSRAHQENKLTLDISRLIVCFVPFKTDLGVIVSWKGADACDLLTILHSRFTNTFKQFLCLECDKDFVRFLF